MTTKDARPVPSYLRGYEQLYAENPHHAGLAWFRDARYGLFLHYGLYSLLGRGEWVMYKEKIPVRQYEQLKAQFTAERFDAEAIADLAVAAEMKYINITTRHHDSFSLFATDENDFSSMHAPAQRDLVAELAAACEKRGLGLMLYYSYGADWRHPYFPSREDAGGGWARPPYDEPEPSYLYRQPEDVRHYIEFMHRQLTELLTRYGSIAGVWFDLISMCYYRPDLFPVAETYRLIRELQPHCLVSFKQGFTGDEDFMSQEVVFEPLKHRLQRGGAPQAAIDLSEWVWEQHKHKWNETCTILQEKGWSYDADAQHRGPDFVWSMLEHTAQHRGNLLLNTGPLPDGSIHPQDEATLREIGRRIREQGFPAGAGAHIQAAETGAGAE